MKEIQCKKCRIRYPELWKVCPACGTAPKSSGRSALILILVLVLVAAAVVGGVFGYLHYARVQSYNEAKARMEQGDFLAARELFLELEDYSDAAQLAEEALLAESYRLGEEAFARGDFLGAISHFTDAGGYADAADRIEVCRRAESYRLGMEALEAEDYITAIEEFTAADTYQDAAAKLQYAYAMKAHYEAVDAMNRGDYNAAIALAEDSREYGGADAIIQACTYHLGVAAMTAQDYPAAVNYFENCGNFDDSKQLLTDCATRYAKAMLTDKGFEKALEYFRKAESKSGSTEELTNYIALCEAELALAAGKLCEGLDLYDAIPTNFAPQEFKVATRRNELKRYQNFRVLAGDWVSSRYNISVVRQEGGWIYTRYYPEGVLTDMTLHVDLVLNKDGTVTINGRAKIYYFTSFSNYGGTDSKYLEFSVANLNAIPGTFNYDESTRIYFGGGKIRLVYQAALNGATTTTDVTYGDRP